jgi:hypothetical protein
VEHLLPRNVQDEGADLHVRVLQAVPGDQVGRDRGVLELQRRLQDAAESIGFL